MTSAFSAWAGRLADFYCLATVLLLGTAAVMAALRQPARRLGIASAALAGLVLLAAAAAIPGWPRVPLGPLCVPWRLSAEAGMARGNPVELAEPRAELGDVPPSAPPRSGQNLREFPGPLAGPSDATAGAGVGEARLIAVPPSIAVLFLAGASGLGLWLVCGAVQTAHLVARSQPAAAWLQAELDRLLGAEGRTVQLRVSRQIRSAVALGVLRPTILLPASLLEEVGRPHLRAILAHEAGHIRHGDLQRLALSRGLLVLLFAHPVYWWLRRAVRQDQELLADAAAVADSGLSAGEYADALVGWARRSLPPASGAAAALGIWEQPSQLHRRIAMLLEERSCVVEILSRRWRYGLLILVGLTALGLSVLTLFDHQPAQAADPIQPGRAVPRRNAPAKPTRADKQRGNDDEEELRFEYSFSAGAGGDQGGLRIESDADLAQLKRLKQLERLELSCKEITDAGLKHLKGLRQVKYLSLASNRITDEGLQDLKGLRQLKHLTLEGNPITDTGLKELKGLTELRFLGVTGDGITDAGLEHLEGLTRLLGLNLPETKITDAGLKHLKGLTRLQYLNLGSTAITGEGLEHLKGLNKLRTLILYHTQITDAGLEHLKDMGQLRELQLFKTRITDAGLAHLQGLSQLQALSLYGDKITDAGLHHLKDLRQLQKLWLDDTPVTDTGLYHLKDLSQLQSLYLDSTQVTDAGLEHLKGLSQLRDLMLSKTQITDAGLAHLEGLNRLETLVLHNTTVTDDAVAKLKQALPNCTIITGSIQ